MFQPSAVGDLSPEQVHEVLVYLDDLRESGETNMFGARPYVQQAFDLDKSTAGQVLSYWMATFGQRYGEGRPSSSTRS